MPNAGHREDVPFGTRVVLGEFDSCIHNCYLYLSATKVDNYIFPSLLIKYVFAISFCVLLSVKSSAEKVITIFNHPNGFFDDFVIDSRNFDCIIDLLVQIFMDEIHLQSTVGP